MVADSLPPAANAKQDNDCKIFVGGLAWDLEPEALTAYFGSFGVVKDVNIKKDAMTGNPRGFGFVVFEDKESVDRVINHGEHAINGKKVDPKRIEEKERIRKIFVGGVAAETSEEEVKAHFEHYGAIEEIVFPTDRETQRRKGFCFITFSDADACDQACKITKPEVGVKTVDVKKAVPQEKMGGGGGGAYGWPGAPRGGRGGMRGGGAYGGYAYGGAYPGYEQGAYGGYDQGYDPYGYGGYSAYGADPYGYGGYGAAGAAGGKMRGGGRGGGAPGRGAGRGRGRGGPY